MSKENKSTAGGKKPAQSTKSAAPKKAATANAAPATAAKKPAAVKAKPASKPAARTSAAKSTAKPAAGQTVIRAAADVGFGNQLFIRGEGGGLSWDRGIPMECKSGDHWEWSANGVKGPVLFKVLINDQLWAHGENMEARPGSTEVVHPEF